MDMGLNGKVALVTGGSDGIGKGTATSLCAEGASVVICARRQEVLDAAAEEIRAETGGEVTPIQADVTSDEAVDALFDAIVEKYGRLDILVNNAGTSAAGLFETVSDEVWRYDLELKLSGQSAARTRRSADEGKWRRSHSKHHDPRWQGAYGGFSADIG